MDDYTNLQPGDTEGEGNNLRLVTDRCRNAKTSSLASNRDSSIGPSQLQGSRRASAQNHWPSMGQVLLYQLDLLHSLTHGSLQSSTHIPFTCKSPCTPHMQRTCQLLSFYLSLNRDWRGKTVFLVSSMRSLKSESVWVACPKSHGEHLAEELKRIQGGKDVNRYQRNEWKMGKHVSNTALPDYELQWHSFPDSADAFTSWYNYAQTISLRESKKHFKSTMKSGTKPTGNVVC